MKTYVRGVKRYAHFKLDGHGLRIVKNRYGSVTCHSSKPIDITAKIAHRIVSAGMRLSMPCNTILLGELWTPDAPASGVKTAINDEKSRLFFHCFAIENMDPAMPLADLNALLLLWGIRSIPYCDMGANLPTVLFNKPLPHFKGKRIEGYVFKDGQLLNCEKWKPIKTIDLIVTDFKDGRGKYLGLMGSLVASTIEGHVVAAVGGMNDQTRCEISLNEAQYLGRIVEVAYQYVGAKGRLRHPRFVRFRDDKAFRNCSVTQDPDLEKYYANR